MRHDLGAWPALTCAGLFVFAGLAIVCLIGLVKALDPKRRNWTSVCVCLVGIAISVVMCDYCRIRVLIMVAVILDPRGYH